MENLRSTPATWAQTICPFSHGGCPMHHDMTMKVGHDDRENNKQIPVEQTREDLHDPDRGDESPAEGERKPGPPHEEFIDTDPMRFEEQELEDDKDDSTEEDRV